MDLGERFDTLRIITADHVSVIFHPPSFTLLRTNSATAAILSDLLNGHSLTDVCRKHAVDAPALEGLLERIDRCIEDKSRQARPGWSHFAPAPSQDLLQRLVLNVSHTCNLRCRYCYAQSGTYGNKGTRMHPHVALEAVNTIYDYFPVIGGMQFFGGEPLLNLPVMETVCRHVHRLYEENKIAWLPRFGVVTNGTILTGRVKDMFTKFNFGVTVSLDGPARIHNHQRPGDNSRGSYGQVMKTITTLQQMNLVEVAVQATFTRQHWQHGFSVVDLMNFFHDRCGVAMCHIVPVSCDHTSELALNDGPRLRREFRDAARQSIRSLGTQRPKGLIAAFGIFMDLLNRREIELFCDAGLSTLAIAANGDVYPCFMLVGRRGYRMGRAESDPVIEARRFSTAPESRYDRVMTKLKTNYKEKNASCRQCWVKPLCQGCIGASLMETNDIGQTPETLCQINQGIAEGVLLEISELQRHPTIWETATKNILQSMTSASLPCIQ